MTILAQTLEAVLVAIALAHLAWGLKLRWPAADEAGLVATVIGFKGAKVMPGFGACLLVAVALGIVALLVVLERLRPSLLEQLALFAASAVFLARGVAAWTPAWRRLTPQQPFARLDERLYGPLCLALGGGLIAVAVSFGDGR
jgi:hypothetical protein